LTIPLVERKRKTNHGTLKKRQSPLAVKSERIFSPRTYWETRLKERFDLTGAGFRRKSAAFNRWVYKVRTEALHELFRKYDWPVKSCAVLDVGCGTGYFIEYWLNRKAHPVVGIDIAETSINRLKEAFPNAEFHLVDLTESPPEIDQKFDYISIFDVLFHIVDDDRFARAIENLASLCKPGCRIFVTDLFGSETVASVKHCRNRSLNIYTDLFSRSGFKLIDLRPLFFVLLPPSRISNAVLRWAGILIWEAVTWITRWNIFGDLLGRILYNIDSVLRKIFKRGPGSHIAFFEFDGTPRQEDQ
jgi:2-polyprenyl-3-methyl-5-hydroxy-6-metoxy-1,4-benzoquinol methylase